MKKNHNPFIRRLAGLALGVLLVGFTATSVHAITVTWTNSLSGNWSDPANWSPGVPADGDRIVFNLPENMDTNNPYGNSTITTNDLTGSSSAAGIVLKSISFGGGKTVSIYGNPVVMDTGTTYLINISTNNRYAEIHIPLILKETIDVINETGSGTIRFWEPMVPYTASPLVGANFLGGKRYDNNTYHLLNGPLSVNGNDFNVSHVADAGVQVASAVALTNGNDSFTYTGTGWDVAQVGQHIWLPAADATSPLPLPIGTTITGVDTANKIITLSTNAVASSTSADGWIGFPSSLGISSKEAANLYIASGSRLRYNNSDDATTDRGVTVNGTITIQIPGDSGVLEFSGSDWVEDGSAAIIKESRGTLVISGTNSISGPWGVWQDGALVVKSPGSVHNVYYIATRAKLFGDGTVLNEVRLGRRNDTTLAPGLPNSVGTLHILGYLDCNTGKGKYGNTNRFEIDIDDTTNDLAAVSGTFIPGFPDSITGHTNLVVASPTALNGVYTFITASNIITMSNSVVAGPPGPAVWVTTPPPGKTHTVSYDTNSTPQRVLLTVAGVADTTIDLASSANPAGESSPVVFTATVQVSGVTANNATGTVTFDAGGVPFYTNSVVGGLLSVTNSVLPIGTTTITATYSGGGEYAPSANSLDQVIQANIPTTPTNIVFSVSGGDLTLSWPADYTGWALECQTNNLDVGLSSNWVEVPGSTTTNQIVIPINSVDPAVFYRLMYTP